MSNDTNDFIIKSIEEYRLSNPARFGIRIRFERNCKGTIGILITYHMMCAMLVLVASTNFLFDVKDSNRTCMLVALLLVLTNYFSDAQVLLRQYIS